MNYSNLPNFLKVGKTAAHTTGAYLRQKLGEAKVKYPKTIHDDLLDADLEAEHIILDLLRSATPELEILSEETPTAITSDNYWIVDPLDGSANFQHGSLLFAVTIALVLNNTTMASIIYLPMQEETFTAIRNQGAFLNDQPIHVSNTKTLEKSIAHLGDFAKGNDIQTTYEYTNDILELITKVYRVRMIGTAATDLAYVACGRADLLINHATKPWDVEAGKLLLLEAGGKTTTKYTKNRAINIYSNNYIHQEAIHAIISSSPDQVFSDPI